MNSNLFLDTSYAIALSVLDDEHHNHALQLAEQIQSQNINLITTRAVLLEIGNALAKQRYREAAVAPLEAIEIDSNIEIIFVTEELYQRTFELFRNRMDKEWGLIDCLSFIVMQDYGLTASLTADKHFVQAGFRALLIEE